MNHDVDVIGIKIMTVPQRQLINRLLKLRWEAWPDEWELLKLVSSCCSASVKYSTGDSHPWETVYVTAEPTCGHFQDPAHFPALTNQQRGGCSVFKRGLEKRDKPVTSWLRKTFNDQISQFSDIRGRFWRCSCDGDQGGATEEPDVSLLLWRLLGEEVV